MRAIPVKTLQAIAAYGAALDAIREEAEPSSDHLTPYLGRISVMLDGELIGYLDDPDGLGWEFETARDE